MIHTCDLCRRNFPTLRELNIHLSSCSRKYVNTRESNQEVISTDISTERMHDDVETATIVDMNELNIIHENEIYPNLPTFKPIKRHPDTITARNNGEEFVNLINDIYNEIAQRRKNIFKLPSGKAAKSFITELTFWLEHFNKNSEYQYIALKVYFILPSLLLQKPSKKSKYKDHCRKLEE